MKFDSKVKLAQALMSGKVFKVGIRSCKVFYDEDYINPFRYEDDELNEYWDFYNKDIWEEVKPKNRKIK